MLFSGRINAFAQPKLLPTIADFAAIKAKADANEQTRKTGYDYLARDWCSSLSCDMQGSFAQE
jgi:hypothetical protein